MLYSHNHDTYTTIHIYMRKRNRHNNDERTQFFLENIPLTLFERVAKGLYVRGELETEQRLQHIDP